MLLFGQESVGEYFAGLGQHRLQVFVSGGKMAQDELPGAGVSGGLGRHTAGGVAVLACCRRVIIRQTMDPDEVYYVRFKTVMDDPTRYLFMDYLEYCAKEVYDNPVTPEDIW